MQLVSTILHAITDMLVILSKNVTKVSLISFTVLLFILFLFGEIHISCMT